MGRDPAMDVMGFLRRFRVKFFAVPRNGFLLRLSTLTKTVVQLRGHRVTGSPVHPNKTHPKFVDLGVSVSKLELQ